MNDSLLLLELRQNHKHVMEMLKHMNDEMHEKLNKIIEEVSSEESELQQGLRELPLQQEKWLRQIAFQAAKIYGEEHDLTKHYKEAYRLETGKNWDDA